MKLLTVLLALSLGASSALAEIYTWKDARGTVFYTNSMHEIPARYLKKARLLDVATGKQGGPALDPSSPGQAAAPGQEAPAAALPVAAPAEASGAARSATRRESAGAHRSGEKRRAQRRRSRAE